MSPNEALAKLDGYLRAYGLRPERISAEGWDDAGYEEFVLDPQGKPHRLRKGRQTVRKGWPEGISVEIVAALFDATRGKGPFSG